MFIKISIADVEGQRWLMSGGKSKVELGLAITIGYTGTITHTLYSVWKSCAITKEAEIQLV